MSLDPSILRELATIEATLRSRGVKVPDIASQVGVFSGPSSKRRPPPDADTLDPYTWAKRYRRIDGKPFSLARHKPLQAIYEDTHHTIVVIKPAQVGVSELAVTRTLHALDVGAQFYQTGKLGLNIAYLFPTGRALSDFSKERFAGAMGEHPHIAEMFVGGFDDIGFKQAGDSYLIMRSTWIGGKGKNRAAEQLLSFPADLLMLDEYDRMDPAAVEMARKRLRASVLKMEMNISTPTIPGYGIHQAYLDSDQRVWQIPCPSCAEWFEMDFFRDVWGEDQRRDARHHGHQSYDVWQEWERERILSAHWSVRCPACESEVDRTADGRWVVTNPDSPTVHGYHVPALAFPMVELGQLALHATSSDPTQVEEFFRSDLGIPYQPTGSTITDEMLHALTEQPVPGGPAAQVVMGVDVGVRFHCRITGVVGGYVRERPHPGQPEVERGQRVVLAMLSVRTWEDVDDLMRRYKVRRCIVDAQPELHGAKQFADRHKGKVYRAFYGKTKGTVPIVIDEKERTVTINRTMGMDAVYARVADEVEIWPAPLFADPEVAVHLKAPQRVLSTDSQGNPITVWTSPAPDHFFHATLYSLFAEQLKVKTVTGGVVMAAGAKGW